MVHLFDADVAKEVGIIPAILLYNIDYWCRYNKANNTNYFDDSYWTFNSVKAYSELFPYLSYKQIRAALQKLEDMGYIKSGVYNKQAYDRTKWYTTTPKGTSICPTGQSLPFAPQGKPIPYVNTDINNIYTSASADGVHMDEEAGKQSDEEFLLFYQAYPRKVARAAAAKAYAKLKAVDVNVIIADVKRRLDNGEWTDVKYIPHPATYLNQRRWEDDVPEDIPKPKERKSY